MKVKPHLLFRSTEQFGKLSPDRSTEFLLLDRIVNVQNGITVPCGLRGTIVGIHAGNYLRFVCASKLVRFAQVGSVCNFYLYKFTFLQDGYENTV